MFKHFKILIAQKSSTKLQFAQENVCKKAQTTKNLSNLFPLESYVGLKNVFNNKKVALLHISEITCILLETKKVFKFDRKSERWI